MNRILVLLLIFAFQQQYSFSQNSKKNILIQGSIIDDVSKKPLDYSSVSLFSVEGHSFITGGITDENGFFELKAEPGTYTLNIQYISYLTKTINITLNSSKDVKDLGSIELKLNSTELNEVVVTGQKDQVEFSLDKRIFNVSENISNIGKSASDILDNIPSVQVDIEGNVSLRGNESVNILIDGKPSGLVGASALQQLQGNMIESIEVVTNPSARYDAEGTAGIINIILKKEAKKGINGSFNTNIGYPANYAGSANMNYRSGDFNFFVSGGLRYRRSNGTGHSFQQFLSEENPYSTVRNRTHSRGGLSQNLRMGADYYFTEKNVLTAAVLLKNSNENNRTTINYLDDYKANQSLNDNQRRYDDELETDKYVELSLNYKMDFSKKGHSLTFYNQFRNNAEIEKSDITQTDILDSSESLQKVSNDEGERNFLFQVDYIHPIGESGKFEGGLKSNLRKIRNDYLVQENDGSAWQHVEDFSSDFEYHENIHALYALYGNKMSLLSYQLGLRAEATDITTEKLSEDNSKHKDYINFFPSAHLTFQLAEGRDLQVSYSRRMRRPWFRLLNPFSSLSDIRNIRVGNPDLNPELTDAYEVGYLVNWQNSSFYGGVYYRNTSNVIRRISQYDQGTGKIYSQPFNLASRYSYGVEMTISREFGEWLKLNGNFNFYRSVTDGQVEFGESILTLDADAKSWSARVNSTFTLPQDIDLQLSFNYRGPQIQLQGERLAFYTVDLGATKDILNDKATITASIQDLFNTRKWRSTRTTDTFISEDEFQWRARQFRLSFVYRLNQKKKRGRRNGGQGGGAEGDDL